MDFLATQQRYEGLLKQRNLFVKLSVGLLGLNVLQSAERLMHDEKTILLPPTMPTSMWVKGGESSKEYLGEWALYLSSMLLNVSPSTIQGQGAVVLKYIRSDFEASFKKRLQKEEANLQKNNTSMSFFPKDVDVEGTKVTVTGLLSTYVGTNEVSQKSVTYLLEFSFGTGDRFVQLANFQQKDMKDVEPLESTLDAKQEDIDLQRTIDKETEENQQKEVTNANDN